MICSVLRTRGRFFVAALLRMTKGEGRLLRMTAGKRPPPQNDKKASPPCHPSAAKDLLRFLRAAICSKGGGSAPILCLHRHKRFENPLHRRHERSSAPDVRAQEFPRSRVHFEISDRSSRVFRNHLGRQGGDRAGEADQGMAS